MRRITRIGVLAFGLSFPVAAPAATTTFRVAVPANTPPGDSVFIAGNFQGWVPGSPSHALTRQPDGRWTITLSFADGQPLEFKFTHGGWNKVEKGASGEEIPNRTLSPAGTQTFDFTVASWADLGTITGRVDTLRHAPFLGGRKLWVYVPPGYESSTERYPVLYMHDGQNLFDVRASFAGEWKVDEACEALIAAGEIVPILVVGIENSAARCVEYTPWVNTDPAIPCGGGGADLYLGQIRDVLIPFIDAQYRTRTGPENTYMAGSSLGGLISHYAGYAYDDVWGRIAGVSTYFPWASRMLLSWAAQQPKPNLSRFYQDMGTLEFGFTDANQNGLDDFIEDLRAMRAIALAQGFQEGVDFLSVEGQGHTHWEYYWAQRMPDLLRFLIDAPPTADAPAPSSPGHTLALEIAPNPVSSSARIRFELPRAGRFRLEIVDLAGRAVRTIVVGDFPAGSHVVRWDLAAGGTFAPGRYWLKAAGGGETAVRPVAIVR